MATHLLKARAADLTTTSPTSQTAHMPTISDPTNAQVVALLSSLGAWQHKQQRQLMQQQQRQQGPPAEVYVPVIRQEPTVLVPGQLMTGRSLSEALQKVPFSVTTQKDDSLLLAQQFAAQTQQRAAAVDDSLPKIPMPVMHTTKTKPTSVTPPLSPPTVREHVDGSDRLDLLARLAALKQKQPVLGTSNKNAGSIRSVGKPLAPPPPLASLETVSQRSKKNIRLVMRTDGKPKVVAPLAPPPPSPAVGLNMVTPAFKNFHKAVVPQKTQARVPTPAASSPRDAKETEAPATTPMDQDITVRKTNRVQFPEKLHQILKDLEQQGQDDIISFVNQGLAFEIHQPQVFEQEIIPKYFSGQQKGGMGSFKRQLHLYGFQRVKSNNNSRGVNALVFCHSQFLKGQPQLCLLMSRVNKRKQHKEQLRQRQQQEL